MKTDSQIQKDVMDEIKAQVFLTPSEIGVSVNNGVVTLSGHVDAYFKKISAENAAKRVKGVKAVAQEIVVGISPSYSKTDTEIAEAALNALKWHSAIKEDRIKIRVEKGNVILEGEVEYELQRTAAQAAVEPLEGVKQVTNYINVKPVVMPANIKEKITAALIRSATVDSNNIVVDVQGTRVTLKGRVHSFAEKKEAESAAWAIPGVAFVDSKLEVYYPEFSFEEE